VDDFNHQFGWYRRSFKAFVPVYRDEGFFYLPKTLKVKYKKGVFIPSIDENRWFL